MGTKRWDAEQFSFLMNYHCAPLGCAFGIHTYLKQAQLQKGQPSTSSKIPLTSASFVVGVESFNLPWYHLPHGFG